jgi:hypothetical protein
MYDKLMPTEESSDSRQKRRKWAEEGKMKESPLGKYRANVIFMELTERRSG